ncbi:hypothetical protein [Pantoea ananatis]|uniref:hypothetical protein n=1 Tax=Pantoea ananas TaxID=553 RepID=UPI001B315920|nr:hypothetical protein [Pantoea ananatis]
MSDTTYTQKHNGSGDNVGTKNIFESHIKVISATTPDDLKEPIVKITNAITNRKFQEARNTIQFIEDVGNLEKDVKDLILLLKIKCDLNEKGSTNVDLRVLNSIVNTSNESMIKDLARSILILVEFEKNGVEAAKARYDSSMFNGPNCNAVAYKLFVEEDELQEIYRNKIYSLAEEELTGLVNGFIRLDRLDEAQVVAKFLDENYKCYNSEFIKHYTLSLTFNGRLAGKDYWFLTQKEKNEISKLIKESLRMFKSDNRHDDRLFLIFFPALLYVYGDNDELYEVCKEHLSKLSLYDEYFADQLRLILGEEVKSEEHPINVLKKAKIDFEFKEKIKNKIISNDEVGIHELWLGQNLLADDELMTWLAKNHNIKAESSELGKFLTQLTIGLIKKDEEMVSEVFKKILSVNTKEFHTLSSEYIKSLAERLVKNGKSHFACDLVFKVLSELEDMWVSPFVAYALNLLHMNGRYKNFIDIASNVNDEDKSIHISNLIIWSNFYHGSPEDSYKYILNCNINNDLQFLALKIKVLHKLNKYEEIKESLDNFDHELFYTPQPIMLDLLDQFLNLDYFSLYEIIVVSWFLQSPEKNYLAISKACLLLISKLKYRHSIPTPSYNIKGLEKGIVYSSGNNKLTKIITTEEVGENQYLLSSKSILAQLFSGKSVGDTIENGAKSFKIESIVAPFIAIKDLMIKLRDSSNDGSDPFQILTVDENSEDLLQQVSKAIPSQIFSEEILVKDDVPLSIKMNFINRQDTVKAALVLLLNPLSKMKTFRNEGYPVNQDACTDLVTVVYMCLTSYSKYFIKNNIKLHLLSDDIQYIKDWIKALDESKSMIVGKNGNGELFVLTSEMFKSEMSIFYNNLISVCSLLNPLPIVLDNYDPIFITDSETFSPNYVKSLYAIKNSSYPYLTVDTQNAVLFHHLFNILPANSFKTFEAASQSLSISEKIVGIRSLIHTNTPYSFIIRDFYELAAYHLDEDGSLLHSLLRKYINKYDSVISLSKFLGDVFSVYLMKALSLTGPINYGSLTYQYSPYGVRIDRIFNLCCESIIKHHEAGSQLEVETKISRFIFYVGRSFSNSPSVTGLINYLAEEFVVGRFLDPNMIIHLNSSISLDDHVSMTFKPLNLKL